MKVRITAHIREIDKDGIAKVGCKIQKEFAVSMFMPVAFEAILKAMKDTDKRAFYEAMANFANEDFDDALEFLDGENEND